MAKRRTLQNIVTQIPKQYERDENGKTVTENGQPVILDYWRYSDLIELVCNTPVSKGVTYKEMKLVYNILSEVEDHPDKVKMRDEEVKKLQSLIENFAWGFSHKEIVKFCDRIMDLLNTGELNG